MEAQPLASSAGAPKMLMPNKHGTTETCMLTPAGMDSQAGAARAMAVVHAMAAVAHAQAQQTAWQMSKKVQKLLHGNTDFDGKAFQ